MLLQTWLPTRASSLFKKAAVPESCFWFSLYEPRRNKWKPRDSRRRQEGGTPIWAWVSNHSNPISEFMDLLQPSSSSAGLGFIDNSKPSYINVSQVSQIGPTSVPGPNLGNPFILCTINHTSNNSHTNPWVIDYGATGHITSCLHWFKLILGLNLSILICQMVLWLLLTI